MTRSRAVRPWVRAFWDERAWPSGVRGPVLCCALAALAARRAGELDIFFTFRLYGRWTVVSGKWPIFVSCGGLERFSCEKAGTQKIACQGIRSCRRSRRGVRVNIRAIEHSQAEAGATLRIKS